MSFPATTSTMANATTPPSSRICADLEQPMRVAIHVRSLVLVFATTSAIADPTCQTLTASQIAQDIQNSPTANQTLKNSACTFGGAGIAESGGNSCASNGNNFGVLQLTKSNLT